MFDQFLNVFVDQTINGLVIGNVYALMAVGLALIFGVAHLINFAHGSVYMFGAYVGWLSLTRLALPLPVTFVVVMVATALLGVAVERIGLRPLRGSARIAPLLSTIAISFVLDQGVQIAFGPQTQAIAVALPEWRLQIGGGSVGSLDAIIAIVGLTSGGILYYFLTRTQLGWAVRATAQDREAALQMGVDVDSVNRTTFAIASALGGLSGFLVALYFNSLYPTMGFQAGLKGFAAGLLGGLGNIPGAIIGSLLLGLVESYGVAWLGASYRNLFAFAIMLAVLVWRPNGLFGDKGGLPPEPMTGTFMASSRPVSPPVPLVIAVAVAAFALPFLWGNPYVLQILTNGWLYGLLALSVTLVSGTTGLMSLGHAGLLAIGAYTSALLAQRVGWPFEVTLPLAALATAGLSVILIFPAFRLRGHYVAVATLGIGEIVALSILNWTALTSGPVGLNGIPAPNLAGVYLSSNEALYWLSLTLLVLVAGFQYKLTRSHLGRILRAIREDEVAAQAYGISLNRYKALAFAACGFIAGISGALTAHMYSYVNHETFANSTSVLALTMVILGGMGNVLGAIVGAVLLIGLPEIFRGLAEYRMLLYGVVLLLLIRFRPQGLLGTY